MAATRRDRIIDELVALMPRVRRFTLGLCGNPADGDDLLQETYARAFSNLDKWQDGTRLDAWTFRIARNLFLNQIRAGKVRENYLRSVKIDAENRPPSRSRAELRLELGEVMDRVAQLPEEQRTVLLLVAIEGLSYAEAADVTGLAVGTVTSRLSRARKQLREAMAAPASGQSRGIGRGASE